MESSPTSSIVFLDLAGQSIDAPVEWTPAHVVLQVDGLDGVSLHCQPLGTLSLSIKLFDRQLRIIADWPRADAGHYHLTLFRHEQQLAERAVTVLPKKIDVDAYSYMLEDLDSRLPSSIILGLQRAGALAGLHFLPPGQSTLAQELARLRRAVRGSTERPGLVRVLKSLALDPHEPHKILEAREMWVPRMHARRPHPSRLTQAVTRPGNLDVVRLPINVLDTRVEHSFDTYENRLLKYFCHLVHFHLRRLIHVLEKMLRKSARLATDLAEARQLQYELTAAMQRASFLSEVSEPAYTPVQITMVLLNHPLYRAMLEGLLEFQKRLTVRLDEPALEAPLENLPKLYQVWGTLHVLAVTLHTAAGLGYKTQAQHLARRDEHGAFIQILPDGRPALELVHPVDSCAGYLGHLFTKSGAICQHDLSCLPYRLHKKYICEER